MDSKLSAIVSDYIAATNAYQPVGASSRGFHDHDDRLGDRSESAIDERMRTVRGFLHRLAALDRGALDGHEPYDADLLERRLTWELTEHDAVRAWQRGPGGYLATIGSGCNGLVIRDFAPLDDRLRALVARLRGVPALLAQAKENLRDPSRYHVETAMEQGGGMRVLFTRDLPEAASKSADSGLKQQFEEANSAALAAVDHFTAWMKSDLMPRANEDFAWGPETFRKLLSETDSIDEPLDTLIARCENDLGRRFATWPRRSTRTPIPRTS